MRDFKENIFVEKFRLLNSQENTEEISWTSSEASDFENVANDDKTFTNLKRKRKRTRKVAKNISNLDIAIVDDSTDRKTSNSSKVSITNTKKGNEMVNSSKPPSPLCLQKSLSSSPILNSKYFEHQSKHKSQSKSPLLPQKYASPKNSPNVRKKLFKVNEYCEIRQQTDNRSTSPVLLYKCRNVDYNKKYDKRKGSNNYENYSNLKLNKCNIEMSINKEEKLKSNNQTVIHDKKNDENVESNVEEHFQELEKLDDSAEMLKITNLDMKTKIISYFNSCFSSENASQHSISDIQSGKQSPDAKNEEIEIIASATPVTSNNSSVESTKQEINSIILPTDSFETNYNDRSKKVRYKKDGLAFRLNTLLKKQNANISLWQHERYLARNSNFRIPKNEYVVFLIQRVHFKYGTYLLEVIDANEKELLILINNNCLNNNVLIKDFILKLYDPYKIINFNDRYKLVINVCKFECVSLET